jgi:uncharacterized cupin superfamily protein
VTTPVVNINELKLDSWERGTLYGGSDVRIGPMIGIKDLGITYSEVPPGKSGCPFHNHHVEDEMFLILEGEGELRFGEARYPIRKHDVIACPTGGAEVAHQIINTGTTPLRYYGISTMSLADVCEYPDSGKFGVFSRHTRNPYDHSTIRHLQHLDHKGVDYWDGEPGSEEGKTK